MYGLSSHLNGGSVGAEKQKNKKLLLSILYALQNFYKIFSGRRFRHNVMAASPSEGWGGGVGGGGDSQIKRTGMMVVPGSWRE